MHTCTVIMGPGRGGKESDLYQEIMYNPCYDAIVYIVIFSLCDFQLLF